MKKNICVLAVLISLCGTANALEYITGKVTGVEATYLPGVVTFTLDTGSTACPAGKWLKWQKADSEHNKAVYSTLMAALFAGKKVTFVINDGDTNCIGQYFHLTNSN